MKHSAPRKARDQNIKPFAPKHGKPDFCDLFKRPMLAIPFPDDFCLEEEAKHLDTLWRKNPRLGDYTFVRFVHATEGGTIFKVLDDKGVAWVMKIIRQKIYFAERDGKITRPRDPDSELRKLQALALPHPVGFREAIRDTKGVVVVVSIRPPPTGTLVIPE